MNWINNINKAVDYIESNLIEDINYDVLERIMACSRAVFQQTFTQISGITISEYIRKRKMTLAAYDLQNTNLKIIDVAFKYGYTSADSFRVAFKKVHSINPIDAKRSDVLLKFYSKLQFEIKIKGVHEMGYKLIEKNSFQVTGVRVITPFGGGTWTIVKSDGSLDKLVIESGKSETLGLCFGFDEQGNNDYMCGVEWNNPNDLEYDVYTYPELKWLVFLAEGKLSDNILYNTWERIKNEFLPNSKYKKMDLPTIEKYIIWDENNDFSKVEICIPVE